MNQLKNIFEAATGSGALQELAGRVHAGTRSLKLTGGAGGARALGIAAAILSDKRPFAVVTPSNAEAQRMTQELSFYLDLLAPSSRKVVHLPDLEVDPYRGLSPHHEISAKRAQTLWHILHDSSIVLVASVRAAAVRLRTPRQYLNYCLMLKQD